MEAHRPLQRPVAFLTAFALTAGILLWGWSYVSGYYLAALVSLVNYALSLAGTPLALQGRQLSGQTVAYPGIAGGVALFLATPSRPLTWKLRWLAASVIALALLHVSLLFVEAQVAALQHAAGAVGVPRHSWTSALGHAVQLWRDWGAPGIALLIWFYAAHSATDQRHP